MSINDSKISALANITAIARRVPAPLSLMGAFMDECHERTCITSPVMTIWSSALLIYPQPRYVKVSKQKKSRYNRNSAGAGKMLSYPRVARRCDSL